MPVHACDFLPKIPKRKNLGRVPISLWILKRAYAEA